MLSFDKVSYAFRGGAGVKNLTFTLSPGEIVALVGLNGAGKTTLMRLALEMLRPQTGVVKILGHLINEASIHTWAQVGALIETPFAYPELTVEKNLQIAALLRRTAPEQISAAISTWQLGPVVKRRFRHLSLGNRQRVALAAAMLHDPTLILLDEPSNALDPASIIRLREDLARRAEQGAAILVSSHHLDEVARIADRIVLMNAGHLIGSLDATGPDLERHFFDRIHRDDEERRNCKKAAQ
ncbi:MAG: ABC transporter ATP-binding protein [Actinomycetaceae bacterium]|nr:ABC transporter ATP-binding protein [Actinomycetaceae bacterium]